MGGMQHFSSFDGVPIAYLDEGSGPCALLLHGFAADHHANWVAPGVVEALVTAGHRVLAPDARGHGGSGKPHDPEAYAGDAMVRDARALLDHVGVDTTAVAGYSMGALTSSQLVPVEPRARALVLGGIGGRTSSGRLGAWREEIAAGLVAENPRSITHPAARAFRRFADRTGADRRALAAIQQSRHGRGISVEEIAVPTLVIVGDRDTLAGDPQELANRIPGAIAKVIKGDHLNAVFDPAFRNSIVDFFAPSRTTTPG
jgi:pimeloyl-ACP methyl ester carboxylesterase